MNRYRQLTSGERYALLRSKNKDATKLRSPELWADIEVRSAVRCDATRRIVRAGPIGPGRWLRSVETRQIAPQRALRCMRVANGRDLTP